MDPQPASSNRTDSSDGLEPNSPEITTFQPLIPSDVEIFDPEAPLPPPPLDLPGEDLLHAKVDKIAEDIEKLDVEQNKFQKEVQSVMMEESKIDASDSEEEANIDDVTATLINISQEQEEQGQQQEKRN